MPDPTSDPLASLTRADFEPLIGTAFALRLGPDASESLELAEASAAGPASPGTSREPFALLFYAARLDRYAPQGIYSLEHPKLGRLEVFLVPLGPDARGMRYEAVFT